MQVGAEVRERQEVISIPSPGAMVAEMSLHESVLSQVHKGLPCRITVDAVPGLAFTGVIDFVSPLPDKNAWFANSNLRLFAEVRAGDETLVRIGADLTFGGGGGELLVRESVTGQRYRVLFNEEPRWNFIIGGDVAYVEDSVYLPDNIGVDLKNNRYRLRAGVNWQGATSSVFYGLTYLSEEFENQPEGQLVGSVRLKFEF